MTRLLTDSYVDFLMWRKTYTTACELLIARHIDENEWRRRCFDLGFTEFDISRELELLKLERKPTLRLASA